MTPRIPRPALIAAGALVVAGAAFGAYFALFAEQGSCVMSDTGNPATSCDVEGAVTEEEYARLQSMRQPSDDEEVDGRAVMDATNTIIRECTRQKLDEESETEVASAVDSLIRNYNLEPEAELDASGSGAATPTEALESARDVLAPRYCSTSNTRRVREALAGQPTGSPDTEPGDRPIRREARDRAIAFRATVIADTHAAACTMLTDELRDAFGGSNCRIPSGFRPIPRNGPRLILQQRNRFAVTAVWANAYAELVAEGGRWYIDELG